MNLQEQHWDKLFGYLTNEANPWYGIWTVYSPEGEVIKSSQGIRILQANADKTVITHINQFPSPDGTTLEKQWQIDKGTCNQTDGLLHPADESKRALSVAGDGATAWVPKTLERGHPFSVELFLKHKNWNHSIGSIYDSSGCLEKILHLREHFGGFPNIPERSTIDDLSGTWSGKKQSITSDLKVSPLEEIQELVLDPTEGKNKTFFLKDAVVLNIPTELKAGEAFEIVAGRLVSDNEYHRLTAQYDDSSAFSLLTSEFFHREE